MRKLFFVLVLLPCTMAGCRKDEQEEETKPAPAVSRSLNRRKLSFAPEGPWQRYVPPHSKYSVLLPGIPQITKTSQNIDGLDYPQVNARLSIIGAAGDFALVTADTLWPREKLDQIGRGQFLDAVFEKVTKPTLGTKIKERRRIISHGMQMDEIEYHPTSSGAATISREMLHGDYHITLTAIYKPERLQNGDVAKYFDSLVLQ